MKNTLKDLIGLKLLTVGEERITGYLDDPLHPAPRHEEKDCFDDVFYAFAFWPYYDEQDLGGLIWWACVKTNEGLDALADLKTARPYNPRIFAGLRVVAAGELDAGGHTFDRAFYLDFENGDRLLCVQDRDPSACGRAGLLHVTEDWKADRTARCDAVAEHLQSLENKKAAL